MAAHRSTARFTLVPAGDYDLSAVSPCCKQLDMPKDSATGQFACRQLCTDALYDVFAQRHAASVPHPDAGMNSKIHFV